MLKLNFLLVCLITGGHTLQWEASRLFFLLYFILEFFLLKFCSFLYVFFICYQLEYPALPKFLLKLYGSYSKVKPFTYDWYHCEIDMPDCLRLQLLQNTFDFVNFNSSYVIFKCYFKICPIPNSSLTLYLTMSSIVS